MSAETTPQSVYTTDDLAKIPGYLLIIVVGLIVRGLVIRSFWAWFVVPLGVIQISTVHALAIGLVGQLITGNSYNSSNKTLMETIAQSLATNALWWLMGALLAALM